MRGAPLGGIGHRVVAWLLAILVLFVARVARADVERFAFLIGNDRGDAQDAPLKYAGADADRVRDVLTQLGGFSSSNVVVVKDEGVDDVRRGIIAMNDRIRSVVTRPGTQVVLFVYYSGHADAEALHLGASRFAFTEFEQLVRSSSAQVRVMLIDACRSGALTRVKGGTAAPPFSIRLGERLEGQGVVFLTSSSLREDAQESDEFGGSFFTHYFVSGLRGAADFDGDGRVQLDEAYRYAYEATVRATSRTWAGTQHPGYRYELGGQGRLTLTDPGRSSARSVLVFPPGRSYLVFRGSANGPVVGEVTDQTSSRRMYVKPDRYFVRARAPNFILEGEISLSEGEVSQVSDDGLRRIEYARLVRKGGSDLREVDGPVLGYTMRTQLRNGRGLCHGAFVGYSFVLAALSVLPRIDACTSSFDSDPLSATASDYGADVRFAHAWDLPLITVDVGFTVGASWLRQTFTTPGRAPPRDTLALRSSVGAGLGLDLGKGFFAIGDLGAETYFFRIEDTSTRAARFAPSLAFRSHLGFGKHW